MKILTGVSAFFSAAHKSRDGVVHGHTWEIIVWFDSSQKTEDAVKKKIELESHLRSAFDHTILSDGISWGEYLGKAILHDMAAEKVEVRRPLEGLFATIER